jgi:CubicO group peptidase (beta-lactamase class C family)
MALALLAGRGQLDWDAPVASYWPGFAAHGRTDHGVPGQSSTGLVGLDRRISIDGSSTRRARQVELLERRPAWKPGPRRHRDHVRAVRARAVRADRA